MNLGSKDIGIYIMAGKLCIRVILGEGSVASNHATNQKTVEMSHPELRKSHDIS